jgi:hypothetical protein
VRRECDALMRQAVWGFATTFGGEGRRLQPVAARKTSAIDCQLACKRAFAFSM